MKNLIKDQEVILHDPSSVKKDHRPTLIKWKGEPMFRVHSFKATVKEILQVSKVLDVVKIGIIGEPDTGKTTLGQSIAHLCHKMSDEQKASKFAFRSLGENEFLRMEETLDSLSPMNYVLQFKDLSFLADKKKIGEVKRTVTKIRHLKEDVKIILIYDYHYTMGLDKYLRQSNFKYFTSAGSSETENLEKLFGSKYNSKIREFQSMFVQMTTKHKSSFRLGAKGKWFSYNYKNPFITILFWNNSKLRYVVSPTRQWVDPICNICTEGEGYKINSEIPIEQFCKESEYKFGLSSWLAGIKQNLLISGLDVFSSKVVQARRYYERALEKKQISQDDIINHYGLQLTKTRLRKKLDGVLE